MFLDESGNLGMGERDTRYFVMATLSTLSPRPIELLMKRKKTREFANYKNISEIKFNNSEPGFRLKVLNGLANKDFSISALVVDKGTIHAHLREIKSVYYNYVSQIVISRIGQIDSNVLDLIIDRSLPKMRRGEFNDYVKYKLEPIFRDLTINIEHETSTASYGLQAVDFIAGACFQKFEHDDSRYFNVIKDKINENGLLVFDKWKSNSDE